MSLKNRIGSFFLLAGAIFLFIFVASALVPAGSGEGPAVMPLAGGAALLFVGARWRLDKKGRPTGPPPGPPPAAAPPPPKKRGPIAAFTKGPAAKAGPAKAGGGPPGAGKPGGGKPGGKPGGPPGAKPGGGPPGKPKKK